MTNRRHVQFWGTVIMAAVLLASSSWSNALAAPKKKKGSSKAKSQKIFTINTDFGVAYDDNIINYSDGDLATFDSIPGSSKFAGLKSKDDWILTPEIKPTFTGRLLGRQKASLALGFSYNFYVRNDIRRYTRFSIEGRHDITPYQYVGLDYSYIPNYFYRNEPFRNPQTFKLQYLDAKFKKHALGVSFGADITSFLKAVVSYQYQHKSYNPEFVYRNLNSNLIDFNASWRAFRPLRITANYGFERAKAKGTDMPDSVLDISYDAWDMTLGARYLTAFLSSYKPELFAAFQYRQIKFQTSRISDVFRLGRKDNNFQIRAGTAFIIPYNLRLEIGYTFLQKKANLPDIYPYGGFTETTSALENELNYNSYIISLKFSRDFQL